MSDHPFYRKDYNEPVALKPNKRFEEDMNHVSFGGVIAAMFGGEKELNKWLRTPDGYVKVHGGITYADDKVPMQEAVGSEWWFGFDCGHFRDYIPMNLEMKFILRAKHRKWREYLMRVKLGEVERDFALEAKMENEEIFGDKESDLASHYWTMEECIEETERFAEQLAVIALLGVDTPKKA